MINFFSKKTFKNIKEIEIIKKAFEQINFFKKVKEQINNEHFNVLIKQLKFKFVKKGTTLINYG